MIDFSNKIDMRNDVMILNSEKGRVQSRNEGKTD
ncbi:hypothetical protein BN439_1315 [Erwinia amylovora Ea644]|nr:hypothetical protein BN439_1315 [Erwinia amylovora Ea644]